MAEGLSNILRRYTSLSVAIDMLTNQRLTLLSPATWQDTNDVEFMEAYRVRRGLGAVLAACFTQTTETYHHWGVFAGSNEGVRIDLDRSALLASLIDDPCYIWRDVEYLTLERIEAMKSIDVYDLPFLKRHAFKDELEFRLIYECDDSATRYHHVPIKRKWMKSITLSPWLPLSLIDSLKAALKSLPDCADVRIQKTTLRDNPKWKRAAQRIAADGDEVRPPPRQL